MKKANLKIILSNIRSLIGLSVIVIFTVGIFSLLATPTTLAAIGTVLLFGFLGYCVLGFFENGFRMRTHSTTNETNHMDEQTYESHVR